VAEACAQLAGMYRVSYVGSMCGDADAIPSGCEMTESGATETLF
jgi:hypothetical protein